MWPKLAFKLHRNRPLLRLDVINKLFRNDGDAFNREFFCKFAGTTNQGTLGENANRRDTARCQWFVRTVSTAFRGKGGTGREREQGQRKRERDEFGMRFAQRVHTRPAQRRGPRGSAVSSTTLIEPPVNAGTLQSAEASSK